MVRSGAVGVLLFSMLCALAVPAQADYPDRPVTAIVGFPAGGLADVVLRAVAEGMKKKFPKGLAVVNRSGAGGTIGASEIVTSKPDGTRSGSWPSRTSSSSPSSPISRTERRTTTCRSSVSSRGPRFWPSARTPRGKRSRNS